MLCDYQINLGNTANLMEQQPLTGWGKDIQYFWEVRRTLLWRDLAFYERTW